MKGISVRLLPVLALGMAMAVSPAFSQAQGGGQTGQGPGQTQPPGGGQPGQPGGRPGQPGQPGQQPGQMPGQIGQPNQQSPFPEMERPIFLSGKVRLDDGTAPSEPVVIERVCNGIPRPEAWTDSKGRFSFQIGQNTAMMADASYDSPAVYGPPGSPGVGNPRSSMGGMRGGFNDRSLLGCELRAKLAGYASDAVDLSTRRALDNPDVGTIFLHRMGNVEGTTISATTLMAPKDARKAFDKGRKAIKKQKWEDAQKELQKAVEVYPKFAAAWYELGRVQQELKQDPEAKKSYEQAVASDPKFISPYLQLALIAARGNKWQEVADNSAKAVRLDPVDLPQAYFYNAVANYNLQNFDDAEKSARAALKLDNLHRLPKVNQILGLILAEKQDFAGAAQEMRNYLKFDPSAQDAEAMRTQLNRFEKLSSTASK